MNRINGFRTLASILVLAGVTNCAGSPLGENVQQSLEADPQLEESAPFQSATDEVDAEGNGPDANAAPDSSAPETAETAPKPGDRTFIGPVPSRSESAQSAAAEDTATGPENSGGPVDLTGIPADLQGYIRDLEKLQVLKLPTSAATGETKATSPFSQVITRRQYARWLFDSYNTIFADEPGKRLRPGNPNDESAFQDVTAANPDYDAIQGLAAAGIIPSALTGNSTAVNFRPDAPLVREDLILWKVPLDTQAALPSTTPEAVTQSWGFQDAASIDPLALKAIAADFQLGDFANFRRAFGYTTLFRPDKAVSRAEAAAVLWRFGSQTEGRTAADVQPASQPASAD
jgi:hypothetical protein